VQWKPSVTAGQDYKIKISNKSFENVSKIKITFAKKLRED